MKKYLLPLMLMASMHSVLAQIREIKLNCQISLTTNYSDGSVEKQQVSELIEIYESADYLFIKPASNVLASVSTRASQMGFQVLNTSNENKWELFNQKGDIWAQIIIDRNTGQIFYARYFKADGLSLQKQGNGTCKKIDTDKKLF